MSTDEDLDWKIATSLTEGPFDDSEKARQYSVAVSSAIKLRAKRRTQIIRIAAVLGAGIAAVGVHGLVAAVEGVLSSQWRQMEGATVAGSGGEAFLLAIIVIALVAECLPQSRQ